MLSPSQISTYLYILDNFKKECIRSNTSMKELYELIGVSRATFSKFWNGHKEDLTLLFVVGNLIGMPIQFWPKDQYDDCYPLL